MALSKQQRDELASMEFEEIHLTPEGVARLKNKLAELKRVLPERAAEAKRTADFGDRSENEEYRQAKAFLRRTNRQIVRIEDQLKHVVIIKRGTDAGGMVGIGSTVVIEPVAGAGDRANRKTFEIVGPMETNPSRGRISNQSPLGAALIGKRIGETVSVSAGGTGKTYRICEIS